MNENHLKTLCKALKNKNNQWLTLKIAAVTFATLTLFSKDLIILFSDALQSEITSHILAVPFIFVYLLYRRRKTLRSVLPLDNPGRERKLKLFPQIVGTLLIVISVLVYWYGSYTFTPLEYHLFALPIFAAGSILLLFNLQTLRHLAFPLLFLFFLVPPPSELLFTIGAALSNIGAQVSSSITSLIGIPTELTSEYGNPLVQITRPAGQVINFSVDIACSGIYSLIAFLMFATLIAYIIRDKPWKRIALILIGVPIIYLFNIFRITSILIIGYHYGETLALQVFHLLGGWVLIFLGTMVLLLISEKILKTQLVTKTQKCTDCNIPEQTEQATCLTCGRIKKPQKAKIRKTDLIKTTALVLTVSLLMLIQAPVFAFTQSPAIVLTTTPEGQQISTEILPNIPGYTLQFDYRDTAFEETAKTDMALIFVYIPENVSLKPVWVSLEIASARSYLHRWETCLINYPLQQGWIPRYAQIELRDITLSEDPPIISRYFAFTHIQSDRPQTALYWYDRSTFDVNSTIEQKHLKISLVTYPDNLEQLPTTENQQTAIAKSIVNYWQPIKTWSPIALVLSQNSAQLSAATSTLLLAAIIYYLLQLIMQKQFNKTIYSKISEPNKQLLNIIQKTKKTTLPTLENIHQTYQKTTGHPIQKNKLLQKITELQNIGLVKSTITSKQDEPYQTWKT